MFDLRYHVASLAAIFVALVIGILVGVGISSSNTISNSERKVLDEQKAELQARLDTEVQRANGLAAAQRAAQAFIAEGYPSVLRERLRGKRIAVVFIGSPDGRSRGLVQEALTDANAVAALRFRALKVPIDPVTLSRTLVRRPALAPFAGSPQLGKLGLALGQELVAGGDSPLWNALSSQLVVERSGGMQRPVDGVVLVRSAQPQGGPTARFLTGLYTGLGASAAPLVGVETSGTTPSATGVYRKLGISSVDDLETAAGRLALVALLAGAQPGHYGLDETADSAIIPPLVGTGG